MKLYQVIQEIGYRSLSTDTEEVRVYKDGAATPCISTRMDRLIDNDVFLDKYFDFEVIKFGYNFESNYYELKIRRTKDDRH